MLVVYGTWGWSVGINQWGVGAFCRFEEQQDDGPLVLRGRNVTRSGEQALGVPGVLGAHPVLWCR